MEINEAFIVTGIFQSELKNRFRCVVKIDDVDEVCYVSSSSRLENFVDLVGKEVLLMPSLGSSQFPYTLFAVKQGMNFTILNLSIANTVIFKQLHRKLFGFLGKRKNASREIALGGYRTDIFIEDTRTAIEIKAIISSEKQAIFPSVTAKRSVRQLEHIKLLLQKGYKVCYMFVSLSPDVKIVVLDRSTPYYSVFLDCVNYGMVYYGCSIKIQKGEIVVAHTLEVKL